MTSTELGPVARMRIAEAEVERLRAAIQLARAQLRGGRPGWDSTPILQARGTLAAVLPEEER